jgi:hypothetical protein
LRSLIACLALCFIWSTTTLAKSERSEISEGKALAYYATYQEPAFGAQQPCSIRLEIEPKSSDSLPLGLLRSSSTMLTGGKPLKTREQLDPESAQNRYMPELVSGGDLVYFGTTPDQCESIRKGVTFKTKFAWADLKKTKRVKSFDAASPPPPFNWLGLQIKVTKKSDEEWTNVRFFGMREPDLPSFKAKSLLFTAKRIGKPLWKGVSDLEAFGAFEKFVVFESAPRPSFGCTESRPDGASSEPMNRSMTFFVGKTAPRVGTCKSALTEWLDAEADRKVAHKVLVYEPSLNLTDETLDVTFDTKPLPKEMKTPEGKIQELGMMEEVRMRDGGYRDETAVKIILGALERFRTDCKCYPEGKSLSPLSAAPKNMPCWKGPYMTPRLQKDVRGVAFRYSGECEWFKLTGAGNDGKFGSKDDIVEKAK